MKTRARLLIIALVILAACRPISVPKAKGTLEGHVAIGPLVPVMREGEPTPTPAPEVYAAREIVVYARNGKTEVARAQIDSGGIYRIALPAGTYVIDINRLGMDHGTGLPKEIEIAGGQVTRLDIEIDTGIR